MIRHRRTRLAWATVVVLGIAAAACNERAAPGNERDAPPSGANEAALTAGDRSGETAPGDGEVAAPAGADATMPGLAPGGDALARPDSSGADAPGSGGGGVPSRGFDAASNVGAASDDAARAGDVAAAATAAGEVRIPGRETMVPIPSPTRTPTRTATPAHTPTPVPPSGGVPVIGGCGIFPASNAWNTDISSYPVHANSQNFINNVMTGSGTDKLHPDFGSNATYGIPFIVVPQAEPMVPVNFTDYGDESDPGPYPIPLNAPNEGGGDRHVIAVQQGTCMLYELFNAWPQASHWDASSGAKWNLTTGALRPEGWTSADAAGLPILPGLVRYDEVQSGVIRHALRFTVQSTQRAYILPATHFASSSTDANRPPMGLRLRLKATYDISGFSGDARVILEALRRYGMIVADNGSNWYISGARDSRWDDDDLGQLKSVPGSAFEVVYTGVTVTP